MKKKVLSIVMWLAFAVFMISGINFDVGTWTSTIVCSVSAVVMCVSAFMLEDLDEEDEDVLQ